jgi:hypothetical protein
MLIIDVSANCLKGREHFMSYGATLRKSTLEGLANLNVANQETDMLVAMATRIYEGGAVYRLVDPDMFEVQSPDGNDKAIIVSADQFRMTLSLVRSLKSCTSIPVY